MKIEMKSDKSQQGLAVSVCGKEIVGKKKGPHMRVGLFFAVHLSLPWVHGDNEQCRHIDPSCQRRE